MNSFVAQNREKINGVLECFDRLILRGHLPMAGTGYFATWLYSKRISLNLRRPEPGWWNYKEAAPWFAEKLKAHVQTLAARDHRPYKYLASHERMEENVRELAEQDGITDGLVCVYGTMETCRTFRVSYGQDGPDILRGPARLPGAVLLLHGSGIRLDAREDPDLVSLHDASVCQRPRMAGPKAGCSGYRLRESG